MSNNINIPKIPEAETAQIHNRKSLLYPWHLYEYTHIEDVSLLVCITHITQNRSYRISRLPIPWLHSSHCTFYRHALTKSHIEKKHERRENASTALPSKLSWWSALLTIFSAAFVGHNSIGVRLYLAAASRICTRNNSHRIVTAWIRSLAITQRR